MCIGNEVITKSSRALLRLIQILYCRLQSIAQVVSPGCPELSSHMIGTSLPGIPHSSTSFTPPLGTFYFENMPTNDEVRVAFNDAMESFQENPHSFRTLRKGPNRRATRSGLGDRVGPTKSACPLAKVSPNSDLGTVSCIIAGLCFSNGS